MARRNGQVLILPLVKRPEYLSRLVCIWYSLTDSYLLGHPLERPRNKAQDDYREG